MLQGNRELPGDCSSPKGSPGSPSLASLDLPCQAAEVPRRFLSSVKDLYPLCCRTWGIWSSKIKWEGAGKMELGLLEDAQRDSERQQQELEQGEFPVNASKNHEAALRVLKYWNRGLERDGNLCPWRYSDLDWSSLGAACLELVPRWEQRPS